MLDEGCGEVDWGVEARNAASIKAKEQRSLRYGQAGPHRRVLRSHPFHRAYGMESLAGERTASPSADWLGCTLNVQFTGT